MVFVLKKNLENPFREFNISIYLYNNLYLRIKRVRRNYYIGKHKNYYLSTFITG